MRNPVINAEAKLRGQPANPGSPEKIAVKTECVCTSCRDLHAFPPPMLLKAIQSSDKYAWT